MIPVFKITNEVREAEHDTDATKYSDYDILSALNKTIRLLSNQLALMNSELTEKAIFYDMRELSVGAPLPDDFISLRKVVSFHGCNMRPTNTVKPFDREKYFISGDRLYATEPCTLFYKGSVKEVDIGGSVDVPAFLFDFIVSTVRLVLTGAERDVLMEHITNTAKLIIPQRKYGNARTGMPFKV